MKLIDVKGITLPLKNDEEFRKIDLSSLYNYEFKQHITLKSNEKNLIEKTSQTQSNTFFPNIANHIDDTFEVLVISKDLKEPLILIYEPTKDETLYANSLKIEVKEGVSASIIEVFKSNKTNNAFVLQRDIKLQKNASLVYAKIQDLGTQNSLIYNLNLDQDETSVCQLNNFEFGEGFVLNTYENNINEKNIEFNLNSLIKLVNESYVANLIHTVHNNESSKSDINIKHTLKDKSTAIFKAKTIVKEKALFTKAFQNSNTILLSNNATILAQPHLEISIDELEASHGATTGTLNKEQLLYLQARGISKELAHTLLLEAFEAQMYEAIADDKIKEYILNYKGVNHV